MAAPAPEKLDVNKSSSSRDNGDGKRGAKSVAIGEDSRPRVDAENDDDDDDDEAATAASHVPPPMKTWQRRLVMLSLCLTLFLGALDITIISTALPSIAAQLHATTQQYAWVGSGYTLSYTASMLVWTKMSDIAGRKPIIMTAAATFMAGSLICALSQSSNMLIGGRVVQGLGGGGSLVLVTIVIGDIFSLADRAKYYGMTGAVWGIASCIGPVLGGVFADSASWRWCFYINLPIDGIAIVVLFFFLKVENEKVPLLQGLRSLDWIGFVLVIGGTVCFLYGLQVGSGGLSPWGSAEVICLLVFGFLLLALFMVWQAKFARWPVIPFRIFQNSSNIATFLVACLHAFIFISFDFFLPLYFQAVLGLRPLISGVTLFALILPLSVTTMTGGFIIRRTGKYTYLIIGGSVLMCLGNGLFILFDTAREWPKIILFQVVAGLGAGTMFQSPMIALQAHLRQKDTAPAMAAYSFLRTLFTSISQVVGTVFMQRSLGRLSIATPDGNPQGQEAYVRALRNMWSFYTAVGGLLLVSGFFIKLKPLSEASTNPSRLAVEAKSKTVEAVAPGEDTPIEGQRHSREKVENSESA